MDIKGIYHADANRYSDSEALYKRCGKSGILLPKISVSGSAFIPCIIQKKAVTAD